MGRPPSQTPNPKPQTLNPKSWILDPSPLCAGQSRGAPSGKPPAPQRQRSTPRLARLFGYHTSKAKGKSRLPEPPVRLRHSLCFLFVGASCFLVLVMSEHAWLVCAARETVGMGQPWSLQTAQGGQDPGCSVACEAGCWAVSLGHGMLGVLDGATHRSSLATGKRPSVTPCCSQHTGPSAAKYQSCGMHTAAGLSGVHAHWGLPCKRQGAALDAPQNGMPSDWISGLSHKACRN